MKRASATKAPRRKKNLTLRPRQVVRNFRALRALEALQKKEGSLRGRIDGMQFEIEELQRDSFWGTRGMSGRRTVLINRFRAKQRDLKAQLEANRKQQAAMARQINGGTANSKQQTVNSRTKNSKQAAAAGGRKKNTPRAVKSVPPRGSGRVAARKANKAKAVTGHRTPKSGRKPNKAIKMTYALAMAAGTDAANRQMKKAGRETWNRADHNKAVSVFERLYGRQARLENPRFPNPPIWADILGGLAGGAGYAIAATIVADRIKKKAARKVNSKQQTVNSRKKNKGQKPKAKARRANTASTTRLYKEFQGRGPKGKIIPLQTPSGTPKDVSLMGPLIEIRLKNGESIKFAETDRGALTHPKAFVGQAQRGEHRRIYIGLVEPYSRFRNGEPITKTQNFGPAASIAYWAKKPHLKNPQYDGRMVAWEHKFGDRGGRLPNVLLRPNGCLDLRYGDYTVMSGGIDN